jgi:hypothetical protein
MRIPVFARRANPSIDSPILRKSESYIKQQLAAARVDWVDPTDPRKGVICREMLYFGERALPVETVSVSSLLLPPLELPGLHLEKPKNCEGISMASVRANWSWMPGDYAELQQAVS